MIEELAVKYNVTPTQGILGWGIARGVGLMVQSWSEAHHKENLNVRSAESSGSTRRRPDSGLVSSQK